MKLWVLLLIFVVLVLADKGLTIANLKVLENKYPDKDFMSVEKNPLAKYIMEKTGIVFGNFIYAIFSLLTAFIGFFILRKFLGEDIALISILVIYALVITNNFYWLLKYTEILK